LLISWLANKDEGLTSYLKLILKRKIAKPGLKIIVSPGEPVFCNSPGAVDEDEGITLFEICQTTSITLILFHEIARQRCLTIYPWFSWTIFNR